MSHIPGAIPENLSPQQLSQEPLLYRSNCRRSNFRRSNCRRSNYRRSNYRRSNCRRSKCRRSKCRRSKCLGAFVAEHLSHFSEQLSAEHMSPEHMSWNPLYRLPSGQNDAIITSVRPIIVRMLPLEIFTFTHPNYNDMTCISFITLVFGREWYNNCIA